MTSRFRAVFLQHTAVTGAAVPALCTTTDYTISADGVIDDGGRSTIFASGDPATGGWCTALQTAEVIALIRWCSDAIEHGIRLVSYGGAGSFAELRRYPLPPEIEASLRRVIESMLDLELSSLVGCDLVERLPTPEPVRPVFPVLDWISNDRLRQLSCVSWTIERLAALSLAHATGSRLASDAARTCLSPVGFLRNEANLDSIGSPETARRRAIQVEASIVWASQDPSFFL